MEQDGLTCGGTFVDFSWHSFDIDGPLDEANEGDGYQLVGVTGDGLTADGAPADDRTSIRQEAATL